MHSYARPVPRRIFRQTSSRTKINFTNRFPGSEIRGTEIFESAYHHICHIVASYIFLNFWRRVYSLKRGLGREKEGLTGSSCCSRGHQWRASSSSWTQVGPLRSLSADIKLHHMVSLYLLDLCHLFPWSHLMCRNYSFKYLAPVLDLPLAGLSLFFDTSLQHACTSPPLLLDDSALLLEKRSKF